VRWVTQLRRYKDQKDGEGRVEWSGPVLAGDRLIAVSSMGQLISVSPYTGEALGYITIPDGTFVPPVVANETLYILTREAQLLAYR
jgi:outer membrane protein assembly factor BamB